MDINTNYSTSNDALSSSNSGQTSNINNTNSILQNNSTVNAEIIDMTKDGAVIKLENGQMLEGILENPGNAKIGDVAEFSISRDGNNLKFSISKDVNTQVQNAQVKDILQSYGFKGTGEQIGIAKLLTQNSFALTKENFTKLNQAVNLLGKDNLDKAIFMLKNNIDVNSANTNTLIDFADSSNSLSNNLKDLSSLINNMPDGDSKNELLAKLLPEFRENSTQQTENSSQIVDLHTKQISDKLSNMQNENISKNDISDLFKDLPMSKDILEQVNQKLSSEFPELKDVLHSSIDDRSKLLDLIENNKEVIGKELLSDKNSNTIDKFVQIVKNLADSENISLKNMSFSDKEMLELSNKLMNDTENSLEFKLTEKFSVFLDDVNDKNIDLKLNDIKSSLELVKNTINSSEFQNNDGIAKSINDTLSNIENSAKFLNNVKTEMFMQFPLIVNNQSLNSEIFVFKEPKKSSGIKKGASALVALDTANIGRYEVYLTKNGDNVHCQFRLDNKEIEGLTINNLEKLKNALKEKSLILEGYTFAENGEKFSLGNLEPEISSNPDTDPPKTSITSFDLRM